MSANQQVEKWAVPAMRADPSRVIRNREASEAAKIPTAGEMVEWQKQAEEEGYQQGLARARQETSRLQQELLDIINCFEGPLQSMNEEIEQELAEVAVTLAQQLVRREIKSEPGEIVGLIRDSVKLLPGNARNISIILHPDDAQLVRDALSLDADHEERGWKLVEDPMITRGGCDIKSPPSAINATLENRLSALAASVLGSESVRDGV